MKRFEDFIKEDIEFEANKDLQIKEIEFRAHMENIFEYIKTKINNEITDLIKDKHSVAVYGTLDHEETTLEFSSTTKLASKLKEWHKGEDYFYPMDDAKTEISLVLNVLNELNIVPAVGDLENQLILE